MSGQAIIMGLIAVLLVAFYVARWIWKTPVQPDPWETDINAAELDSSTCNRVCDNCLTPVSATDQHYCPVCGNATGDFTRYMPFVNIRFNYSLLATLWLKVRSPEVRLRTKVVAIVVILICAPLMILVGLPILLYGKLRKMC
jgi:hypothetical protein